MSTEWNPPQGDAPAPDLASDVGGVPALGSEPADVARAVFADLKAQPMGYLLSGTSYLVAAFAVIGVAVLALGLGMAPGLVAEDDVLLAIGGSIGFLVYTGLILFFSVIAFPVFTASAMRGIDRHHRGGAPIGFFSLVDDREGAGRIVTFYLLSQLLVLIGVFLLYVPGIIAAVLSFFCLPMVVLERVPAGDALRIGWDHMRKNPGWHFLNFLLMVVALVALELTIVGLLVIFPVIAAWQLFAHRVAFGPEGARAWVARQAA